jgi:hypothetical protein
MLEDADECVLISCRRLLLLENFLDQYCTALLIIVGFLRASCKERLGFHGKECGFFSSS